MLKWLNITPTAEKSHKLSAEIQWDNPNAKKILDLKNLKATDDYRTKTR